MQAKGQSSYKKSYFGNANDFWLLISCNLRSSLQTFLLCLSHLPLYPHTYEMSVTMPLRPQLHLVSDDTLLVIQSSGVQVNCSSFLSIKQFEMTNRLTNLEDIFTISFCKEKICMIISHISMLP